ncbi:MAG TPA: SHOCT domain-containing protein [Candidatus Tetragenococcus pullicola]|nr:SHOCT domain-containing protein [Candidatus Tetragenococcus pullicola]
MDDKVENNNNESLALRIINGSLKLPIVKVNRSEFLVKIFGDKVEDTNKLIEEGPQAFFSESELDKQAKTVINNITAQSTALSFAAGIPGGLAMAATIPADITQFYAYSLRLAQEISYIYGYENIWDNQDELTEKGRNTLILYLGIMLGVNSAGSVVRVLSSKLSVQALKKIPQKAMTKTLYYPIIKKVLAVFGTKVTKSTFAKGVSKVVPVVGGVVSGGLNLVSMRPMANKLKNELRKSVNYTTEDLNKDLKILNDEDVKVFDVDGKVSSNDKSEEKDIFKEIEKAHELLMKDIITEAEFEETKKKLLTQL